MTREELKQLEKDLLTAADSLRANSDLKSSEYSTPLLGLIFFKFADNKYRQYEAEIIAEYQKLKGTRCSQRLANIAVEKCRFYLPDNARLTRHPKTKTIPSQFLKNFANYMSALVSDWDAALDARRAPSLILPAAFNLDFVCIHPFRDGNGRVSRLLWLLQSYRLGCKVGRYISLERLVKQSKDRYYETPEQSSQGWHGSKHDPWPYVNYVLSILKTAYARSRSARVKSKHRTARRANWRWRALAV